MIVITLLNDDENEKIITVKPLPWHAENVSSFFHRLNNKMKKFKSTQAKCQLKQRVEGSNYSLCLRPVGTSIPEWAFDTNINKRTQNHFNKMKKEVGMLLQKSTDTRGVEISSMRKSIYLLKTTPIDSTHSH